MERVTLWQKKEIYQMMGKKLSERRSNLYLNDGKVIITYNEVYITKVYIIRYRIERRI